MSAQPLSRAWADAPAAAKQAVTKQTPTKSAKHKSKRKVVQKSALYNVTAPTLRFFGSSVLEPIPSSVVTHLTEQFAPERVVGDDLETTLRQANEEHPVEFPLSQNLKLGWQLKNWPTAERYPDVGMKLDLRYRF